MGKTKSKSIKKVISRGGRSKNPLDRGLAVAANRQASSKLSTSAKERIKEKITEQTAKDSLQSASDNLKAAIEKRDREYQAYVNQLDCAERTIIERIESIRSRKAAAAEAHGNPNASGDDLIEFNAGGKIIAAKRGTLCHIAGTRLESLFSGIWERKLQKDRSGRIFLDVNPESFQAIVDCLNDMKNSTEENPPDPPSVSDEQKHILATLLRVFGISEGLSPRGVRANKIDKCKTNSCSLTSAIKSAVAFSPGVNVALNNKLQAIKNAEQEISLLENMFGDQESFINSFACGDSKDVVTLNVSGTLMTTKRSTLLVFDESVLARQFDDTTWTDQENESNLLNEWTPDDVKDWVHTVSGVPGDVASIFKDKGVTGRELFALSLEGLTMLGIQKTSTACLLLGEIKSLEKTCRGKAPFFEHSPYCFGKIVDYLRLKRFQNENFADEPSLPTVRQTEKKRFEKTVKYFFPGGSAELILGRLKQRVLKKRVPKKRAIADVPLWRRRREEASSSSDSSSDSDSD